MRTAVFCRPAALVLFLGVLLLCARPSSAGEITHKRFMKEFARFVQGVVENEPSYDCPVAPPNHAPLRVPTTWSLIGACLNEWDL